MAITPTTSSPYKYKIGDVVTLKRASSNQVNEYRKMGFSESYMKWLDNNIGKKIKLRNSQDAIGSGSLKNGYYIEGNKPGTPPDTDMYINNSPSYHDWVSQD